MRQKDLDLDDLDLDDLEDWDSEEVEEIAPDLGRNDYVSGMWGRYGFDAARRSDDKAESIRVAHKMVQAFVDAFANGYRVTFDPSVTTAGTDLGAKTVTITPAPVFDDTLTVEQAGVILTGMATHEVTHDRYGRGTATAVRRVFGRRRSPDTLSNLLDDVRGERHFASDFPGYADVFKPMLDYVGQSAVKREGVERHHPTFDHMLQLAIGAVRYPYYYDWSTPSLKGERDWWQAWAKKWAMEDSPRRHVEGVREGLRRIAAIKTILRAVRVKRDSTKMAETPLKQTATEAQRRLARGLESLPPISQKAMRMAGEGKTGAEIAAVIGLSVEDTRLLMRTARRMMAGGLPS